MKRIAVLILLLAFSAAVYAQAVAKPISQAEFVRMLYKVESDRSAIALVVSEIRNRGIDFKLTSGLRSLTDSKSGGDAELRRTLEEANRRRESPELYSPPDTAEASAALNKTRELTLAAVEEMPDFVVKQRIKRSVAFTGTGNFRNLDDLIVGVSYRASGKEEYRILSRNGVVQNDSESKSSYSEVGGSSSTGEFVSVLRTIFDPESRTDFRVVDTDLLRGRRTLVYDFEIERDRARQQITSYGFVADSTITGVKGRIWIDREKFRVLRIESSATQIPYDFPVTAASRTIDYEWVDINEETHLLPSFSDVRLTFRQGRETYDSRNLIRFKDYQKFGTEVIITDDDDIELPIEGEETEGVS